MEAGEWEEAMAAYHRCVRLEPESGNAWNNLAAAALRTGQHHKAFLILQVTH